MRAIWYLVFALPVVFILSQVVASRLQAARIQRRCARFAGDAEDSGKSLVDEAQIWLKAFALPLAGAKERARVKEKLHWAGFRKSWQVDLFFVSKLVLVVVTAVAGWLWLDLQIGTLLKNMFDTLKYLLLLFLASRLQDWWLTDRVTKRRAKIRAGIPQALDLLTLCVEAGVSLEDAFGRVSVEMETRCPEIAQEFRLTRSEMLVIERSESLRRMERRCGVRELEVLAGSLLQSLQYGTPIVEALRNIAAESRAEQVAVLEEKAGAVAARIGVPLVVLILFPLVALIAAPAAINLIRAFGSK